MSAHRLEITISEDTLARLDSARGFEKRASFVKRALESALNDGAAADGSRSVVPPVDESAVSTRAPDEPVATVLGAKVRKSRKTPSLKDTWGR